MKSPFKFLDSYTKEDREIFFGREREIEELYHRVFESKIMLVYGVSGTGKSSLIHCGLANKFQETDWLPLVIRRGGNILEGMSAAIKTSSITQQTGEILSPANFRKAVRSLYLDHYKPIFFTFDQFEELFIFAGKDEKQEFIKVIKSIVESEIQCRFIFVIREEYMAHITEFERYIPTIFQNRIRIEKMSHINALDAIQGPCKIFDISLEEGFAEALLEKLSPGSADVELTYMQVFLDKMFKLAANRTGTEDKISFNNSLLANAGDVKDMLGSFLDEQVSLLPDPALAMTVLKSFVSVKGTKRPATFSETIDNVKFLGKNIIQGDLEGLLQIFIKLRLITDKDSEGRYELRHDTLAEKIFEKFSLAEKELVDIGLLIENAYQYFLKRNILLSNDDLIYISNKDSQLQLNDDLRSFLEKSRRHQAALKKTFRRLIAVSALAIIILLTTIVYKISNWTKISNANRYAYESIYQVSKPFDRVCLAVLAWKTNKSENSRAALLESFNYMLKYPEPDPMFDSIRYNYLKKFSPVSSPIEFAICSKDNRFIYGYLKDSVIIWDIRGNITGKFRSGNSPLISLIMNNKGDFFAGICRDSILKLWNFSGTVKFTKKIRYNPINTSQVFRFTKNDNILTLSDEHDAELLDQEGKCIQEFDHHHGSVNGLDVTDDGRFIATASSDSTVDIWYLNSDKKNFEIYNTLTPHSDTVWSIDFAPNNRYVVTTSKDRSVKVTSINNNSVWWREKYFFPDESQKIAFYPNFAVFDESGSGIIIKSFETKNNSKNEFRIAFYYDRSEVTASAGQIKRFDYITFSPDKQYFAYASGKETSMASRELFLTQSYTLLLINSYKLLKLNGQRPFFSNDGKYVYTISGNQIESWFIDTETIARIETEYYYKWYDLTHWSPTF